MNFMKISVLASALFCIGSGAGAGKAANCTSGSRSCSFVIGGGDCCVTVTSLTDLTGWVGSGRPQWIVHPTQTFCGTTVVRYLFTDCRLLTSIRCGSPASASCT